MGGTAAASSILEGAGCAQATQGSGNLIHHPSPITHHPSALCRVGRGAIPDARARLGLTALPHASILATTLPQHPACGHLLDPKFPGHP